MTDNPNFLWNTQDTSSVLGLNRWPEGVGESILDAQICIGNIVEEKFFGL